jgi:membrane-associated phospholipid phosphatase
MVTATLTPVVRKVLSRAFHLASWGGGVQRMTTTATSSSLKRTYGWGVVARVLVVCAYFCVWSGVYSFTNTLNSDSARSIHMTRPCDLFPDIIQPWTAIIYLVGGLALPLLPFFFTWEWRKVWFVLLCYAITTVLACICYLLWPLSMVRPSFEGPGVGRWLMRHVVAIDNEANCFPSSHVFYAVLGAILVGNRISWPVRLSIYVLAAAVCISTVTTGQHYFLDVLGGVVFAIVSYAIARLLLPTRTTDGAKVNSLPETQG